MNRPTPAAGVAAALLIASLITIVMALPVLASPSTRLFGWETDGREHDPYTVIEQFRAGTVRAPYLQPATDLPGRWLARILGPVAALNVVVLTTFPLSAAAAYGLARHATGSHAAALVAGLAYAFSPFHLAHAAIHPHIAQTQWFPLYVWALWACLEKAQPARIALLLLAAVLVVSSSFYGALMLVVLTPPMLLGLFAVGEPGPERRRAFALTLLALAVLGAVLLWIVAVSAPILIQSTSTFAFPRADLFRYSARWWSYLVPPVAHPLIGETVERFWEWWGRPPGLVEQQVSVGWSLLVLAAVPFRAFRRRSDDARPRLMFFAGMALLALLCSLSPAREMGALVFVRPSALIYEYAPMFRSYARFGMVVQLSVAMLAAFGVTALCRRPRWGRPLAATLLVALAFEYAPLPWRWRDVLPTSGHRWLAAQPGPLHVLDCVRQGLPESTLPQLMGHRVSFLAAPDDCHAPGLAERCQARGITHVVMRRRPGEPPALPSLPGLTLVRELPDAVIWSSAGSQP